LVSSRRLVRDTYGSYVIAESTAEE
jgi:hypothetical protein